MSTDVIKSYLVSLGFSVENSQLRVFENALRSSAETVAGQTSGMTRDLLKFQISATAAFATASLGVLGYIDRLASGDQQMRLFAMRSMMTLGQARSVKMALDTLGVSLDDVAWDKELHARFVTLIDDQKQLAAMLGPGYEKQMMDVRDLRFELSRLELKGEYFGKKFASDLLKKLGIGDGNLLGDLQKLNAYVLENIPRWADILSDDVIPVLGMTKDIAINTFQVLKEGAGIWQEFIGIVSGDASLQNTKVTFDSLARSIEYAVHYLGKFVELMLTLERVVGHDLKAGFLAAGGVKDWFTNGGGDDKLRGAFREFSASNDILQGTHDANSGPRWRAPDNRHWRAPDNRHAGDAGGMDADQARALAGKVAASTGVSADLIYAQWAHETGGFTNRGARDLNNLAGIKYPGSDQYRSFDSPDAFADYYGKLITGKRYGAGVHAVKTPEAFAHALKQGGYYAAPEAEYAAGMRRNLPGGGAGGINIGSIPITIAGTSATPAQISAAVAEGVQRGMAAQNVRNQAELGSVYR